MTETKEIKGEVEGWSKEVRDFNKNGRGCRGIKVEGTWHNLIGLITELTKSHILCPKGIYVKFTEKKNLKGYWDISSKIEQIDSTETVKPDDEVKVVGTDKEPNAEAQPDMSKIKVIDLDAKQDNLLIACLNAAIEEMICVHKDPKLPVEMNDFYKLTMEFTERFYKGLMELKKKLKEGNNEEKRL